jgi:small subunit ribosomal protein S1
MAFLLAEDFDIGIPVVGEIRTGQVVSSHNNNVLVDIGAKSEAVINPGELTKMDQPTRDALTVGNDIPVFIINPENKDGEIVVSYVRAMEERDWELAYKLLDTEDVYEGRIIGFNKGGLLTRVGRVRGFIPASQLSIARRLRGGNEAAALMQKYVGKFVSAKVIEVDRTRNRLIMSERAAEKEVREAKRTELMENLEVGKVIKGQVVNLADFGAFIDIGGMEGLIHVSEISWKRDANIRDILSVGEEINVYILSVDEKKQRVALSTKRLEPDPWSLIGDRYHVGQLVAVTITKLAEYGAFARLHDDEYDFEGLIHISEIADDHIKHPSQIVRKGEDITARIIRIASDRKQIGLSLKQVVSERYLEADIAWAEANEENTEEEE